MSKTVSTRSLIRALRSIITFALVLNMMPIASISASSDARAAAESGIGFDALLPDAPGVVVTKADALLIDKDSDGKADAGDTLRYTVIITNTGSSDALGVVLNDTLDANLALSGTLKISPLARNDAYNAVANTPLSVSAGSGVLGNDLGSPTPAVTPLTNAPTAQGGAVTLKADGSFIYTPTLNFLSPPADSFSYTITNSSGSDSASVSITVSPAGAPIAVNDAYTATVNTPRTIAAPGVLGNDTVNFATITAYAATTTQGGSVTLNPNGSFVYTPTTNFLSPPTDTFTYTLSNALGSNTATVNVTVSPPGPPDAVNDSYSTTVNTPLSVPASGVLGNDTLNGAGIAAYASTTTQGGSVALNANGSFVYTPTTNFVSPPSDTFTYTLSNVSGSDTATVTITVNPPGAPIAVNDTYTATVNTPRTVAAPGVLGNDTVNFATITAYAATTTQGGSVTLNANGSFVYTPTTNFLSPPTDAFTYTLSNALGSSTATVSFTVYPPGPPIAVTDAYTATMNTPRAVAAPGVLNNDTVNFAAISAYAVTTTQGFSVKLNADGSFVYTPTSSFLSPPSDTFTYTLTNALGSSTTTVSMTVFPPPPIAADDNYTATGNVQISIPASGVLGNDTLNTGSITFFPTSSANGGAVALNANGSFTYNPPPGFEGTDTFTYTLSNGSGGDDATVNIAVNDVIWFVNNTAGAGDGRLTSPYNSLASLQGADLDDPGDVIFVYQGSGNYAGGLPLENNQALIGQGVSLASALTALGITLAPNSATLPGVASNPTIVNAGGNGVTTASNNTVRGVTLGNASAFSLGGSSFGTLNIDTVTITNTTGGAISLTTGTLSANLTSVTSTGGTNGISLSGAGGTLTIGAGSSLSGASGATFNVNGGAVSVTFNGNITQANAAALVNVAGGHTGTLTFQNGTLGATNGAGLQFDNADGTYNFNGTTTLNGGDAGIDILNGSSGAFTFSSSASITNPSGTAFNLNGGNANVTYNGSITKSSAGRAVDIQSNTGGGATLAGTISSTGSSTGILVQSNTGGTFTFSGGTKTLNTGANGAVTLNTNTGATFNFTGGGLGITTTSGAGFTATGGGTVNVTGSNNTIASTTGTALNVTSTTIGASGLTFRSISANGGAVGIILDTTGATAGLSVTGDGSTLGSGGTLQNLSQDGVRMRNTRNSTLKFMNISNVASAAGATCTTLNASDCNSGVDMVGATNIVLDRVVIDGSGQQGLNGHNLSGFQFTNGQVRNAGNGNDEFGMLFSQLSGSVLIQDSIITRTLEGGIRLYNNTGTLNLTIQRATIGANDALSGFGEDGFQLQIEGSASATILVDNSDLNLLQRDGIDALIQGTGGAVLNLTVQNSRFINNFGFGGVTAFTGNTATARFTLSGNLFRNTVSTAINLVSGNTSTFDAQVLNNTIQHPAPPATQVGFGIRLSQEEDSNMTALVQGNSVSGTGFDGMRLFSRLGDTFGSPGSTGTLHATVQDNTIAAPLNATFGMDIQVQNTDNLICLDIRDVGAPGNNVVNGNVSSGIRARRLATGVMQVEGLTLGSQSGPTMATFLNANNTSTPAATATGTFVGVAAGTCRDAATTPLPSLETLPAKVEPVAPAPASTAAAITPVNIGTLAAGESVVIVFDVKIASPLAVSNNHVSNQATVSGSNFSTVLSDDPDTAAPNDPTVTPLDIKVIYLPMLARNQIYAPDLVVQSINVTGNSAQVVIRNQGNAPVSTEFYVDLYVNPNPVPTGVNQIWDDGRSTQGIVWGVTTAALGSLQPGGSLTLTLGDAYYIPDLSRFTGPLPAGTPIYVQVDSANAGVSYGAVLETHEISGAAYNNISGPVSSSAASDEATGGDRPAATGSRLSSVRRP